MMLAALSAKRSFDSLSEDVLNHVDYSLPHPHSLTHFQDTFPSQRHQPQDCVTARPSLYYKRVRSNDPDILTDSRLSDTSEFSQHKCNAASSIPSFAPSNELYTDIYDDLIESVWPNGHIDSLGGGMSDSIAATGPAKLGSKARWGSQDIQKPEGTPTFRYDDLTESVWPNGHIGSLGGGMSDSIAATGPAKLGSKARWGSQGIQKPEETPTFRYKVSRFDASGLTSRRQPVPGENVPFLAASGRQTTSSRGADNPLSARSQSRADSGDTSKASSQDVGKQNGDFEREPEQDLPTGFLAASKDVNFFEFVNQDDWVLDLTHSSRDDRAAPRENTVSDLATYHSWPDRSELEEGSFSLDDSSWVTVPNPPSVSTGSKSRTAAINLLSDASTSSEIPINFYDPYAGAPFDSTDEYIIAKPLQFAFGPDNERPELPGNFHFASANTMSDMWVDAFMPESSLYPTTITDGSQLSVTTENVHVVGREYAQRSFPDHLDYYAPDKTPDELLHLTTEDTESSSYISQLSSSLSKSSTTPPRTEVSRNRHKKLHKFTTMDPHPRRGRDSSSLIFGSADFGRDSSPFHMFKGLPGANFASNDNAGPFDELGDETSGRGQPSRYTPSETSAGHEFIENFCYTTKTPEGSNSEGYPRSMPRISAKTARLKHSSDATPLLILSEDTNDTQPEVQAFLSHANQKSNPERNSSNSPAVKIATTWEHMFVVPSRVKEPSIESIRHSSSSKLGRRTGPLDVVSAENARKIRKLGSCLRCRLSKIACTPDEICKPCLKAANSPHNGWICSRARLAEYTNLFLPEQAVRSFQKASVDRILSDSVAGFSDNCMEVFLSSGPTYPLIKVMVCEFTTRDQNLLVFKKFEKVGKNRVPIFKDAYSPPLGITDFSQDLNGKITDHVREIINGERNYGEVVWSNTSQLAWDIYETIRQYQKANYKNSFLQHLLMLHAMQYLMNTSITILRSSSEEILSKLRRPAQLEYSHNPSLRLIAIQIKQVLLDMIRKTYFDVLEELERHLRPKEPAFWAPTFCCIMILNMCAEMVQETTDLRTLNAIDDMAKSPAGRDKNGNKPSYEDSIHACRILDDSVIASATGIFHLVNKTKKSKDGMKREKGFNPIRDGLDDDEGVSLGTGVKDLVVTIRSIVATNREYTHNMVSHWLTLMKAKNWTF